MTSAFVLLLVGGTSVDMNCKSPDSGHHFALRRHSERQRLSRFGEGKKTKRRKTMIAPASISSLLLWMKSALVLLLFAGTSAGVNCKSADCRHHFALGRSSERRKLNGIAELGVLSITDQNLLKDLGDVLVSRTDRASDTAYRIHAVDLSPDEKTVYYAEKVETKTNTTNSETTAVWKAGWVDALQSYNISHFAGPWPVRDQDVGRGPNSSDVSGLLMLDGSNLLVSQKHNGRLQKVDVATGREGDSWALLQPLGLAKHPAQEAFFVSSGDRVNKISLTVPSSWGAINVVAGPETNKSEREYVDSEVSAEVRFRDPLIGPQSLSRDGRRLYVLDYWNNVVRRVNIPSGATKTIAGSRDTMFGLEGGFNRASMCIVTRNDCNLFVSGRGRLHWLPLEDPDGNVTSIKIVAELVLSDGSRGSIMAMALTRDDRYLFAGTGDGRIMKLAINASALHQCGSPVGSAKNLLTRKTMPRVVTIVGVSLACIIIILCAAACATYVVRGFRHGLHGAPAEGTTNTTRSTATVGISGVSGPSSAADPLLPSVIREIPLSTLQAAIKNGTRLDGKSGSYGDVFKASLMVGPEMMDVAIKVMKGEFSKEKHKQFKAEVFTLSNVRHRHLCKLLGFCTEGNAFILVYPFISGGSLYDRLHPEFQNTTVTADSEVFHQKEGPGLDKGSSSGSSGSSGSKMLLPPLTWTERMSISKQIATCLRYLHREVDMPIVHRDVKSRNVLLEGQGSTLHAYLSDFGLARPGSCDHPDGTPSSGQTTVPTLTRSGTPGYMPPEYAYESKLTMSSDVFAFGVVLLELVTGMRAVIRLSEDDSIPLYMLVRKRYGKEVLVENTLRVSMTSEEWGMADTVVQLALRCTNNFPSQRPHMGQVVQEIEAILQAYHSSVGREAPPAGHALPHPLCGPSPG